MPRRRRSRSRTSASGRLGRRPPGRRARVRGRRHRRRHRRRVDDRRAVRQERAREEGNRTILEKVREAAMAFQLTHRWTKTKLLREYLNSIYFGNGAYGVESAARVYFGSRLGYDATTNGVGAAAAATAPKRPSRRAHRVLKPYQAALLAGMIANPAAFNPISHPQAATARRNLVLQDMLAAGRHHGQAVQLGAHAPVPHDSTESSNRRSRARPVLHQLGAPQILAMEAVGPFRVAYYGGLPDPHDDRPADAAGRRAGDLREPPDRLRRADGVAGLDRQQDRPGPCDGRRPARRRSSGLRALPVQPRHAGRTAAGLVIQGVHAGGGAPARLLARSRCSTPSRWT